MHLTIIVFHASGILSIRESKNHLFYEDNEIRYNLGLYDQCISSRSQTDQIEGQYCSVFLKAEPLQQPYNFASFDISKKSETGLDLKNPRVSVAKRYKNVYPHRYLADLVVGLCLPSSCRAEDVRNAVAQTIGKNTFYFVKKGDRPEANHQKLIYSFLTSTEDRLCHTESKILDKSSHDDLSIVFA